MNYAEVGATILARRALLATEGGVTGAYRGGGPRVGFIPPTVIYDRMRAIDAAAKELDALVQRHVARQVFREAWSAWYVRWKDFFYKYRPDSEWWGTMAKLGAAFYTEELAAQVEGYRIDLERFRAGYMLEKDAKGNPVPPPPTPQVLPTPEPPPKKSERPWWLPEIPWWGWALGVVVVGGVAYSLYRSAKVVEAKQRGIETHVLPKLIGSDLAKAASARDEAEDHPGLTQLSEGPVLSDDAATQVDEPEKEG